MPKLKPAKLPGVSQVELLRMIRDDIKELDWEKVGDDGITALVSKPEVLEIIQDWIEYILAPQEAG